MRSLLVVTVVALLSVACFPQTRFDAAEAIAVNGLHTADAIQTCIHLSEGAQEHGIGTPNNCTGAASMLIISGPLLALVTARLARRYPRWTPLKRIVPLLEIGFSINAIRCSNTAHGCNSHGF